MSRTESPPVHSIWYPRRTTIGAVMREAAQYIDFPARDRMHLISRADGVCGGRAHVEGTRIAVWHLVASARAWIAQDLSGAEIEALGERWQRDYPSLTARGVRAAADYYDQHVGEIQADIRENAIQFVPWSEVPKAPVTPPSWTYLAQYR